MGRAGGAPGKGTGMAGKAPRRRSDLWTVQRHSWETSGAPGNRDGVTVACTPPVLAVTGACCVPQQCVYPRKPGLSSPSFLTSNPTVMVSTWAPLGLCKGGSYQMGTREDAPLTANLSRTWVNALGSKGR